MLQGSVGRIVFVATIRPFHGLRYASDAGPVADLVAPPYDVLRPEERDAYAVKNTHNIVHLTLPQSEEDDRSKFVKYARSASTLEAWRREGVLTKEARPAFYRYVQSFTIPGADQLFHRTALITLLKVEPYENGVVLPHEQTFPKHKEDRLRLLEATRTHLECIYGLYDDDSGLAHEVIAKAPGRPVIDVRDPDGVRHAIEVIDDSEVTCALAGAIGPKKVWIADGHHRYETALNFRNALGDKEGPIAEDFMMMALSSMRDPGLLILPTHRILENVPLSTEDIRQRLTARFPHEVVSNAQIPLRLQEAETQGQKVLGVALPGGDGVLLHLGDPASLLAEIDGEGSDRLKLLDVTILHRLIFERLLGFSGLDFFSYTRVADEAIRAVEQGSKASFLMNPPTVEDMRIIAMGGEKMPQKSTYYYPKLLSGLVLWSLGDYA